MKPLSRYERYELVRYASQVVGADLLLLHAIAWRANAKKDYQCFPGYTQLAEDTHCSKRHVIRATKSLERKGYITLQKRPRQTTLYTLNVPFLQALELEKRELSPARAHSTEDSSQISKPKGYDDPLKIEAEASTDSLEHADSDSNDMGSDCIGCLDLKDVIEAVRWRWPHHPIWRERDPEASLEMPLLECIELAGNPTECGYVLVDAGKDQRIHQAVQRSTFLGAYIRKCFPKWLKDFGPEGIDAPTEDELNP